MSGSTTSSSCRSAAIVAVLPGTGSCARRILDWRILPSIAVATLIVLPHATGCCRISVSLGWDLERDAGARGGGISVQAFYGVYSLGSAISAAAWCRCSYSPRLPRQVPHDLQAESPVEQDRRADARPLPESRSCWSYSVWPPRMCAKNGWSFSSFLIPLYLCLKIEAANIDLTDSLRRFLLLVLVIALGALVLVSARAVVRPWFGDYSRLNIPYGRIGRSGGTGQKASRRLSWPMTSRSREICRMQFSGAQVTMPSPSNALPVDMSKRPLLAVWHDDAQPKHPFPTCCGNVSLRTWHSRRGRGTRATRAALLYGTGEDRYSFSYIWCVNRRAGSRYTGSRIALLRADQQLQFTGVNAQCDLAASDRG